MTLAAGLWGLWVLGDAGGRTNQLDAPGRVGRSSMEVSGLHLVDLNPGEKACLLLGWEVSREGHSWLDESAELVEDCTPSVLDVEVERLAGTGGVIGGHWAVKVKAPVRVLWTDEHWKQQGWVEAEKVEVVK